MDSVKRTSCKELWQRVVRKRLRRDLDESSHFIGTRIGINPKSTGGFTKRQFVGVFLALHDGVPPSLQPTVSDLLLGESLQYRFDELTHVSLKLTDGNPLVTPHCKIDWRVTILERLDRDVNKATVRLQPDVWQCKALAKSAQPKCLSTPGDQRPPIARDSLRRGIGRHYNTVMSTVGTVIDETTNQPTSRRDLKKAVCRPQFGRPTYPIFEPLSEKSHATHPLRLAIPCIGLWDLVQRPDSSETRTRFGRLCHDTKSSLGNRYANPHD